jgi:hypothetical protein
MGMPSGGSIQTVIPMTLYHHYAAGFIQDDWKPTRRLTLNIGLRWDIETGTGESHGQLAVFDMSAKSHLNGVVPKPADPIAATLLPNFTDIRGLLSFADGPQQDTNWRRLAPRFGFAYRLNENTVLRGGYGLSYVPQSVEQTNAIGINYTTNATQGSDSNGQVVQPGGTSTPTFFLTDPFRYGIQPPPGTSQGANTNIGASPNIVDPNRRVSYVQQYNLMVQRLLPKRIVLDIGYVGSHGVRLPYPSINLNQLPTWMLDFARANWRSGVDANGVAATSATNFLQQQVANPFYGIITDPAAAITAKTYGRAREFYAYPQYDNIHLFRPLIGMSKYNAAQVTLRKTYSNGLSAMTSFAFAKAIDLGAAGNNSGGFGGTTVQDIYNLRGSYSLSSFDIPYRFTGVFSYDLPFGRGRRFGRTMGGFAQKLIGGWQTSGNVLWQSGTPVTITAPGIGYNYMVRFSDRVYNVAANIPGDQMRSNIRSGLYAFNPDAYAQPLDNMLGNSARNNTDVRRDSYKNVSLSVLKNFNVWNERVKAQLRGEFLNAFNMVVFGTPGTDVSNRDLIQNGVVIRQGTFARVTTQGNQPRNIQLVLRFSF